VIRFLRAIVLTAALAWAPCGFAAAQTRTPPPTAAPAAATPSGELFRYSGQILDLQRGYVFFSTGDAFRLAPGAKILDYATKQPSSKHPGPREYAQATFDGAGNIVTLELSAKPLPAGASYVEAHKFAVALSTPAPNPELDPNRPHGRTDGHQSRVPLTGKVVQVRFVVSVPPLTPLSDPVYIATDTTGWNAQAIRLDRIDGTHYAVTMPLRTGTDFAYKYTRGTWQTAERGRTGIEESARTFFLDSTEVGEPDTKLRDDVVYNWADYNPAGGQPVTPGTVPTPFNPRPFGFPTPFPTPTPKR